MKRIYLFVALFGLSFFAQPLVAASSSTISTSHATATESVSTAKESWENLSRKEKRVKKKEMRKELKQAVKNLRNGSSDDLLLLVILAILLPPLAMYLYDGLTNRFWISLILTLLFFLPGMIYTLIVILGEN